MKIRKKPSNVFDVPKWMQGLRAIEPEGNMTPDQVAVIVEICLLLHEGNPEKLRNCLSLLVPKVPLKNQRVLKAFIACTDSNMLDEVYAFISQVNVKLSELKVEPDGKIDTPPAHREDPISDDWREDDEYGPVRSKHCVNS